MSRVLRIGTRGSDLALWQARLVQGLVGRSGRSSELVIVHTSGDRDRSKALHQLPGSGFFTKELQVALQDDRVDMVVHSLKDLAIEEPDGLVLGAILERHDPSDLLLARPEAVGDGPLGLAAGVTVGTSSLRRAAQTLHLQPDIEIRPIRGNVPTRVRLAAGGSIDAVLLAAAGVERLELDLSGLVATKMDPDVFIPAPGQGALAIEIRRDDAEAAEVANLFHDDEVAATTRSERAVLHGLGGGCHLPLGAHARVTADGGMRLIAALGELDADVTRSVLRRVDVVGPTPEAAAADALKGLTGTPPR